MFKLNTASLKFVLLLVSNVAVWGYFYMYLADKPLVLKLGDIALPRTFINDSLYYGITSNAVIFYLNYYLLLNRYMSQSISRYLMVSGSLVLSLTIIESLADFYLLHQITEDKYTLIIMLLVVNFFIHSVFWVLSATLKTSMNWIVQERLKNVVNAQRIDAELNLLKSQVHPHFLFNTLNTLYSSAYQFGDNQTADGIGKLSHLLRYMLYETASTKVELEKEIEYLENYIELQKMRFTNEVEVSFIIQGDMGKVKIAPMLLITLVENAFKHGVSPAVKTQIKICLHIKNESQLIFSVENTKFERKVDKTLGGNVGGLGLKNLQKRLAMLYPKQHQFVTEVVEDKFIARLELS